MTDLAHIRAVALDFDGTLLEPGLVIRDEARAAIERAAAAGVLVATASGRPFARQLEILTANGLGAAVGVPHALCCDERSVWLLDGGAYRGLEPWNRRMDATWRRLLPLADQLIEAARRDLAQAGIVTELHVVGDERLERGIVDLRFETEALCSAHGPWLAARVAAVTAELQVSWNFQLLQIIAAEAGKGHSLRALASAWGLAPREVLAVGDRPNDVPMLGAPAGLTPACVGNALPEITSLVRERGGYVAVGEIGLGVAEILDRVVADRERRRA